MATTRRFVARHGLDNNSNSIDNLGVSGASLTRAGAHSLTLTTTGSTNVTLPTTGTLFVLPTLTSGSVLFSNGTTIAQDNANLFWDDTNNRLGIGTTSPNARLESLSTTEQLRLTYSTGNHMSVTVGSTGGVTFNAAGTGAGFTFSDTTSFTERVGIGSAADTSWRLLIEQDTGAQLRLRELSTGATFDFSINDSADAEITTSGTAINFVKPVAVQDSAYGAGWNGSTYVPTRNAVYDRLEQMKTESFIIAASDEITSITAGTNKVKFRMPYAFTVTAVRASLSTAQTSGNIFTVDINESGTSILSTKLTIDNTETTSTTAATAPVISDTALADDSEISVDVDQIGDGTAKGLKITIIGFRP